MVSLEAARLLPEKKDVIHACLQAFTLALFIWGFGALGAFDWLERSTVKFIAFSRAELLRPKANEYLRSGMHTPGVVLVDKYLFETEFGEKTPLDRRKLASVLERVLALKPRTLVVDFDLSPTRGNSPEEALAQERLNSVLATVSSETTLVLPVPGAFASRAAIKDNQLWMKRVCDFSNVRFGYQYLVRNKDVITVMADSFPSLGIVAANISAGQRDDKTKKINIDNPCSVAKSDSPAAFLDDYLVPQWMRQQLSSSETKPINNDFFFSANAVSINLLDPDFAEKAKQFETLFLGGNWSPQDKFATAAGVLPGVVIHAGTFATALHPVTEVNSFVHHAFEVLSGAALLLTFGVCWRVVNRCHASERKSRAEGLDQNWLIAAARLLGSYLLPLSALVGCLTLCVLISIFLLSLAIWFNPGLFLLAALLKFLECRLHAATESLKEDNAELRARLHVLESDIKSPRPVEEHDRKHKPQKLPNWAQISLHYWFNRIAIFSGLLAAFVFFVFASALYIWNA